MYSLGLPKGLPKFPKQFCRSSLDLVVEDSGRYTRFPFRAVETSGQTASERITRSEQSEQTFQRKGQLTYGPLPKLCARCAASFEPLGPRQKEMVLAQIDCSLNSRWG